MYKALQNPKLATEIRMRASVEFFVIEEIVKTLLKHPQETFLISVDNHEDEPYPPSRNIREIMNLIWQCDEEHLMIYKASNIKKPFGWLFLVFGNDGPDIISDYTTNLDPYIETHLKKLWDAFEHGKFEVSFRLVA